MATTGCRSDDDLRRGSCWRRRHRRSPTARARAVRSSRATTSAGPLCTGWTCGSTIAPSSSLGGRASIEADARGRSTCSTGRTSPLRLQTRTSAAHAVRAAELTSSVDRLRAAQRVQLGFRAEVLAPGDNSRLATSFQLPGRCAKNAGQELDLGSFSLLGKPVRQEHRMRSNCLVT